MTLVELIALNQERYNKILVMERPEDITSLAASDMTSFETYTDMNLVDNKHFTKEAKDYFLLEKDGLKDLIFMDDPYLENFQDDDKVLVIII